MSDSPDSHDPHSAEPSEPGLHLTPSEARILACLMEKELATPDNYPLTLNALTLACNQKSNREPVMKLTLGEVGHLVRELEQRDLVRIDHGDRAEKIRHRMKVACRLNPKQQAILTLLMLRRPLTLNEIRARSERMATFDGMEEVLVMVEELMERARPFILCLPKGPGRREERYTHNLSGDERLDYVEPDAPRSSSATVAHSAVEERLAALEQRVAALEQQLGEG